MKNISQYISELLFEHECVIIPGIGGFVANAKPASIDKLQHKMLPPSKQIGFNTHLTNNDGLLADYITQKESVSYNQAIKQIDLYILNLKEILQKGAPFLIDNVGTLYIGANNKILFEPSNEINYSLDAFGLSAFHALPVQRDSIIEEVEKVVKKAPEEVVQPTTVKEIHERRRKVNWKKAAIVSAALPFVAYLAWIPSNSDLFISGGKFQSSDLNPFSDKVCEVYESRQSHPSVEERSIDKLSPEVLEDVSGNYAKISLLEPSDKGYNQEDYIVVDLGIDQKEKAVVDVVEKPVKAKIQKSIKIIAGCFSVRENAQDFVNRLRAKGYDAFVVDIHKGLYRVSSGAYSYEDEASEALKRYKSQEKSSAWLLRN